MIDKFVFVNGLFMKNILIASFLVSLTSCSSFNNSDEPSQNDIKKAFTENVHIYSSPRDLVCIGKVCPTEFLSKYDYHDQLTKTSNGFYTSDEDRQRDDELRESTSRKMLTDIAADLEKIGNCSRSLKEGGQYDQKDNTVFIDSGYIQYECIVKIKNQITQQEFDEYTRTGSSTPPEIKWSKEMYRVIDLNKRSGNWMITSIQSRS